MESRELIEIFRRELSRVEAQGSKQVTVVALLEYIAALEKGATESNEYRRQQYEGKLAEYAADNDKQLEMLRAVLESGKSALQSLLIINGGAVVALMGVMANLAGKPDGATLARYLALPLLEFGLGVLCGSVGFAFRYFSQACYSEGGENYEKIGDRLRIAAIISGISGFILFGLGVVNSYHAVVWSFAP
ncbi:MAG: hypothetical protein SXG53_21595 [Pseudomonadota bacterium]|nr:hypothetical protein [Pseudomonadota bacterium]